MWNIRSVLLGSFIGALACGAALAQSAPAAPGEAAPPPPGAAPDAFRHAPPPPPPPLPGPRVLLDRSANGLLHVDVKCGDHETTQDCANIASQMLDKLGAEAKTR